MHGSVPTLTYMSTLCVHLPSPSVTPQPPPPPPPPLLPFARSLFHTPPSPPGDALSSQLHIRSACTPSCTFPTIATPPRRRIVPPPSPNRRDRCPDRTIAHSLLLTNFVHPRSFHGGPSFFSFFFSDLEERTVRVLKGRNSPLTIKKGKLKN